MKKKKIRFLCFLIILGIFLYIILFKIKSNITIIFAIVILFIALLYAFSNDSEAVSTSSGLIVKALLYAFSNDSEAPADNSKDAIDLTDIMDDAEKNIVDTDKDGFILISELYPNSEDEVVKEIKLTDVDFDLKMFSKYSTFIFNKYIETFTKRDSTLIYKYVDDDLYYFINKKINKMKDKKIVRRIENLKIKGNMLKKFFTEGDRDLLVIAITTESNDYYTTEDGFILTDKDKIYSKPFLLTFSRKKGSTSKNIITEQELICKNCGKKLDFNGSNVCEYCHTPIRKDDRNWYLIEIKNIKIKTR